MLKFNILWLFPIIIAVFPKNPDINTIAHCQLTESTSFATPACDFSTSAFIKVDQFGYLPGMKKIAVISDPQTGYNSAESFSPGTTYELWNAESCQSVFSASISSWDGGNEHGQSGDIVWWFDFSSVQAEGNYFIYDPINQVSSYTFSIGKDVYKQVLVESLKTFYYQRCGTPKSTPYAESQWTDVLCHQGTQQDLDCRLVTNQSSATSKDLSGGWHDAGDYNKYVNFTFETMHDLLAAFDENRSIWGDDFGIPESGNNIPDILDEIKWELDWLIKMQETDGSSLMKVSVDGWQAGSPPSSDGAYRFYGEAQASATRVSCSIFAHASLAFEDYDAAYAATLLDKAEAAWDWVDANPATSSYGNTGFSSANPEISAYKQNVALLCSAAYLWAKTGETEYRDYFDDHYDEMQPYSWWYWYPFETVVQDAMLYYTATDNATSTVVNNIRNNCTTSVSSNNTELLPAYLDMTDAYRAYLKNDNYTWGSNEVKTHTGTIFSNMLHYLMDTPNANNYKDATAGYLHFLHGVNPMNLCMLSNMSDFNSENSCNEIYHAWFHHGTDFDNAETSLYGPAPGFISGGCNPNFTPDPSYGGTIEPPQNQPQQKSYKDWNTGWPENSWEITEPSIYNQAAYIKLLSKFISQSIDPLSVNFFVATDGDDSNPGSIDLPWATIQKACDSAIPGSTVYIREGSYFENLILNVSGTQNQAIHFRNYENEIVYVDGTGAGGLTMLEITDKNYITIEGLHFKNAIGLDAQGILIQGSSHDIQILNNKISEIHFSSNPNETADETKNSQPLIVYGDNATLPITNLTIDGNEIFNCRTGYSEGLAVNGNVDGFTIKKNTVYDIKNIGIDMIGHEGTCSDAQYDQARNGLCAYNTVYNCASDYATAGGIYVDGAKDIIIEKNTVYQNQWGIEIGCENIGKTTENIRVRNNLIYNNEAAGIAFGGYDYPSGSGKVINSYIFNNTCYHNDTSNNYNGEIAMTYTENCIINNNIFSATSQNVLIVLDMTPANLTLNHNLFYCPGGAGSMEVAWAGTDYLGFGDYQSGTGQDAQSQFIIPSFVSTSLPSPDLHLQCASEAKDSGDPTNISSYTDTLDFNDHPRIAHDTIDQGAIEFYKLWTGNTDDDWNTNSNWSPPAVPNDSCDVIIKSDALNFPEVKSDSTFRVRSLLIEDDANIIISTSDTLRVK